MKEYSVTQWLPDEGQFVWAYGRKTFCCIEDADDEAQWHRVRFGLSVTSYKLKKEIPADPEESILESYEVSECWDILSEEPPEHLIGVTKWKHQMKGEE